MLKIEKNDPLFRVYVKHVLKWEGLTSSDPDDTASSCYPGGIHTNKGVTFCTFKKVAPLLGIAPVTHKRFLALTDDDISAFVYYFCTDAKANKLPERVALSVTEAAWGSGPNRAAKHLQDALNDLGFQLKVDGKIGPATLGAANSIAEDKLYKQYWKRRRQFIDYLVSLPLYKKYKNGWNNRIRDFRALFA